MSDYTIDGLSPVTSDTYSSYEVTGLDLGSFNFQTLNNFKVEREGGGSSPSPSPSPSPSGGDDDKEEDLPILPIIVLVLAVGVGVMFLSKK